jgi:colicin import membrane protein
MVAEDSDGVGEAIDDSLRIALTVASQIGERLARVREQLAREREATSAQQARELENRFEAERFTARAHLAPVRDASWWATADAQDIGDMHRTATEWRGHDTAARQAAERIRSEVRERYGVDVEDPGGDQAGVADQIAQAEHERAEDRERKRQAKDAATAQRLLDQADRTDQAHQESGGGYRSPVEEALKGELADWNPTPAPGVVDDSGYDPFATPPEVPEQAMSGVGPKWDSADRRDRFARDLTDQGVPAETIRARILADGENATHPRQAVVTAITRRGRGLRLPGGHGTQREHDGQTR